MRPLRSGYLLALLLLASCSASTRYRVAESVVKGGQVAYRAFLRFDAEKELALAREAVVACPPAPGRAVCLDREIAARREVYYAARKPVLDAIVVYRTALRAVEAGQEGNLARAVADLLAALAALGVEVPK